MEVSTVRFSSSRKVKGRFLRANWRPKARMLRRWRMKPQNQALRRPRMKSSRKASLTGLTALILIIYAALPSKVLAASNRSVAAQWSVQVDKVQPGDVNIGPSFRVAIYENLLEELVKAKQFEEVLRDGDRDANSLPSLLILKTTVEAYTEGSETR